MSEIRVTRFQAMGSPCQLHLHRTAGVDVDAVSDAGVAEVRRLEAKFTRYRDDSVTAAINASAGDAAGVDVDAETAALLDYAAIAYQQSDGLFDITSGILRRVWDFKSGRLPSQQQVDAVRALIGWDRVRWQRPNLVLPERGMQLDFGGFVKEYSADRVAELCRRLGVHAGLVDLGGDLCVVGPHPPKCPGEAPRPWKVGIRHPTRPGEAMASIDLAWGAIASSGDYERCMVVDGVRYGHILNPRTGWPVEGLASVSVVAEHCLVAGTASTVAMLKGETEGIRWLEALGLANLRMDRRERISGSLMPESRASSRPRSPSSSTCVGALEDRL